MLHYSRTDCIYLLNLPQHKREVSLPNFYKGIQSAETDCGGLEQLSREAVKNSRAQDFFHPSDRDRALKRQWALPQTVITIRKLSVARSGQFLEFMKPKGLLTNGWEQTGDLCLVISSVLAKLTCFMHTSVMPWKLHAEDDRSPRWKEFKSLYHHLENSREQDVEDFGFGDITRFGVILLQQLYRNLFDPDGRANRACLSTCVLFPH